RPTAAAHQLDVLGLFRWPTGTGADFAPGTMIGNLIFLDHFFFGRPGERTQDRGNRVLPCVGRAKTWIGQKARQVLLPALLDGLSAEDLAERDQVVNLQIVGSLLVVTLVDAPAQPGKVGLDDLGDRRPARRLSRVRLRKAN